MSSILVLEDNIDLLQLYGKVLTKAGYSVELVNTLAAAERHLNENVYNMFICDMQIDDGSSLTLLGAWIERLHSVGTCIVAISGRMKYAESCEALGVDRFIIKPMMSDVLRGIVYDLLAHPLKAQGTSEIDLYGREWGHM
ncbi:MAG: response regulator [Chloroflexota bacterium]|nr:response regulator [Chloroflexota bacterium]